MRRFERAMICLVLAACAVASPSPVPDQGTSRNIQMAPAVHAANAIYSNSWALVIGINQYQKVPRLQYAVADATSVAAALKGLGFPSENTFVLIDGQATREAIRKVLEGTIRRRAEPTDRLFVLFSGHGVTETLPGGGEEGWLVPVDGDPNDLPLTAISMTDLKSLFKRLPPKHTMLVVDACYGGYTISKAAPTGTYDAGYLERLTRERVVRVLTAGSKNEKVVEEGGHGILTAKLLKGLSGLADMNGDGLIPAMELFAWLDPLVVRDSGSRQKPVFGSLDGEGEFVFVIGAPVPDVPVGSAAADLARQAEARKLTREQEEARKQQEGQRLALLQRDKEAAYQKALDAEFQRLLGIERYDDVDLAPAEKEKAWEQFLAAYSTRNQHEDHARGRVRYWEDKAREAPRRPVPPPVAPIAPAGTAPSDMVFVPAGEFQMGSNDGEDDEKPVHTVYLDAYYIDKTEVTVGAYRKCVEAGRCTAPDTEQYCNWGMSGREDHPVNCVDWNQAKAYADFVGKRLPTEAEWEKAARGTDGRKFPWGSEEPTCQYAVMDEGFWSLAGCGQRSTWPVGSKPAGASPYGALDMAGNVWEWVADWCDSGYYSHSPRSNPRGPDGGSSRVLRGGGRGVDGPWPLRATFRIWYDPGKRRHYLGFRLARTL